MADVRLIDANELKAKLYSLLKIEEAPPMFIEGLETALAVADVANTIDAVPVVHARWLPGVPITCSLCGKPAAGHGSTTEFWLSPYCPWCGQPMDAKEVEADG